MHTVRFYGPASIRYGPADLICQGKTFDAQPDGHDSSLPVRLYVCFVPDA